MLKPEQSAEIGKIVQVLAREDRKRLEGLRAEIRSLKSAVRSIKPRNTTAVSLVSTDAGENVIEFNPYVVMPVRVVDSHGQVLFLDALSPFVDIEALSAQHLDNGEPRTPLGRLIEDLGLKSLWELSPMIPRPGKSPDEVGYGWIAVYRDLAEWASLYDYLTRYTFATHTLVVRDGFLRSKIFSGINFVRMWDIITASVEEQRRRTGRKVFVVGLAKHSKVVDRYHLAMFLEGVVVQPGPCYVSVPREMEQKVYKWAEYARGAGEVESGEQAKFVVGSLCVAKFGPRRYDPIWPVDIWSEHVKAGEIDEILGYLLADAQAGFPKPYYPLCLQRAHEEANLSGFDMSILQDVIVNAIRDNMPQDTGHLLDAFQFVACSRRERENA